jgi:hypothetical protein
MEAHRTGRFSTLAHPGSCINWPDFVGTTRNSGSAATESCPKLAHIGVRDARVRLVTFSWNRLLPGAVE